MELVRQTSLPPGQLKGLLPDQQTNRLLDPSRVRHLGPSTSHHPDLLTYLRQGQSMRRLLDP